MIIKGSLDLKKSSIESLGNIKEINGELDLSGTKITKKYIINNFPNLLDKCGW